MDDHDELHDHDLGLSADLPRILGRRGMLRLLGGAGLTVAAGASLAACGDDAPSSSAATSTPSATVTGSVEEGYVVSLNVPV
jgi:hypothetical protein